MAENESTYGSDKIKLEENNLIIVSPVDMEDWRVTQYRKLEVVFQERSYCLVSKKRRDDRRWYYELEPWPEDMGMFPGRTILYDLDYVQDRDKSRRLGRVFGGVGLFLLPLKPLLGLLWSNTKLKLNDRFGVHPLSATNQSLFLEFFLGFGGMVFMLIMLFASSLGKQVVVPVHMLLYILFGVAIVTLDAIMRWGKALRGVMTQYGFYEWLFAPLFRLFWRARYSAKMRQNTDVPAEE